MKRSVGRSALAVAALTAGLAAVSPSVVQADETQGGAEMVVLNPGGGRQTDGSDGLQIILNGAFDVDADEGFDGGVGTAGVPVGGSDQVGFADTQQWCCYGAGPVLNIGGVPYGEAGPADYNDSASWDSITVAASSGAVDLVPTGTLPSPYTNTSTGDASATLVHTIEHNGLTYQVIRQVSYVYPNPYYDETFTIVIPAGNTEVVKFYIGGDSAPGEEDDAFGMSYETPSGQLTALAVEPTSQIYLGYAERYGADPFDGVYVGEYSEGFGPIDSGDDLGIDITVGNTDVGLDVQWTLGSTPGSFSRQMRTLVGYQGVSVTGGFVENQVSEGGSTQLQYELLNTLQEQVLGLGFTVTLPAGLVTGDIVNSCGGTASVTGGVLTVAGVTLESATACQIVIPVSGPGGEYDVADQSIDVSGSSTEMIRGYAVSTLVIAGGSLPSTGSGSVLLALAAALLLVGLGIESAIIRRRLS